MVRLKSSVSFFFSIFLVITLNQCGGKPEPINYSSDECEYCRMQITDKRYGAELVTDKGKVYKFDSIECLINFALAKNLIGDESQTMLVTDFGKPEIFLDCKKASYVHNDNFRSPMGLNVSAFENAYSAQKFISDNGGKEISWLDVIEMVKKSAM